MINVWSRILGCEKNLKNVFFTAASLLNLASTKRQAKQFSGGKVCLFENRQGGPFAYEKQLPTLIYIQNPITWFINKIDFKMLKSAWDPDFNEQDFKRGTKQAIAVICTLISRNLWDRLRGLVSRQALIALQRDVEVNWSDEKRRNINLETSDIKLALPRKVHFLRIADQKFVDVDMMCVAMKFKDPSPGTRSDLVLVEIVARFHRNYTHGEVPNWTVTVFKVTRLSAKTIHQDEQEILK